MSRLSAAYVLSAPDPYILQTCNPRPLIPSETPSQIIPLPPLPSAPRQSLLDLWFTLSTHLVPAACPRTTPDVPVPYFPSHPRPDTEEHTRAARDILELKRQQWCGELDHLPRSSKPLWACVNRYTRKGLQGLGKGVTLFVAHGVGFHKEVWEPTLLRLIELGHAEGSAYEIDEIWSWEPVNHGDAFLVNKDSLGGLYDWRDNARDILHFLLHYLPSSALNDILPTHLKRIPEAEGRSRKAVGISGRDMAFAMHSFGACTTIRAAVECPALFPFLVLADAAIIPGNGKVGDFWYLGPIVKNAVLRLDGWRSRDAAREAIASSWVFKPFDPVVVDIFVECALHETPTGEVKLKMPVVHECIAYVDQYCVSEAFELLGKLDDRVELRWVVAGRLSDFHKDLRRKMVWRRPANSSHVIIPESGHMILQEAPRQLAREIHEALNKRHAGPRQARL